MKILNALQIGVSTINVFHHQELDLDAGQTFDVMMD
jgi:hypothetical protein